MIYRYKQREFMKKLIFLISSLSLIGCTHNTIQPQESAVLYQSMDWVSDGVFTQGIEGPAVAKDGTLYAVNYREQGTIGRVSGKGQVSQFIALPKNSIGNGIRFDKQGNMYIADYVNHNILMVDAAKFDDPSDKETTVYAHSPLMNQPNDLAINDQGVIFASDPNWEKGNGNLWRIGKDRQVTLLESDMGTTNGIEVSPNNQFLYVNESVQRNIWQYQLDIAGNISHKTLLINFSDHGLDGMRTDQQGNLYIARYGKGVIAVVSPQGTLLREVKLTGSFPTNIAFGGDNGKQVFVTMQKRGAIESFFIE
jgi:sugar lactone lactonase YvrE